jgi:hypothetical protein
LPVARADLKKIRSASLWKGIDRQVVVRFNVAVNALFARAATGKRYVLRPAGTDTKAISLEFKGYAAYVHGALIEKGYTRVKASSEA